MKDNIKNFFNDVTPDFIKNGIQSMFSFIELNSPETVDASSNAKPSTIAEYKPYAPVVGALAVFSLIYIAFGLIIPLLKLAAYGFGMGFAYTHLDDKLYPSKATPSTTADTKTQENQEESTNTAKISSNPADTITQKFSAGISFISNLIPDNVKSYRLKI